MNPIVDILLADLRHLLADLGRDGGRISASIYDTAQVIRLSPPDEGVWPALEWLLAQQQADGGWGDPSVPRARDLPTLAAVLALHSNAARRQAREAVQEGLAFLHRQASWWGGPLPEDLPVGVELLLPSLLHDAAAAGLSLTPAPYRELITLGHRRRALIQRTRPGAATTAAHSWEAWDARPEPSIFDKADGVGHSPAATAAWIAASHGSPQLDDHRALGLRYLAQAAYATGAGIPGIMPTVWPINRFERLFGIYALMMAGLLDHAALAEVARAQMENIAAAIRPSGFSFSDAFEPDGDDTAAGLALLKLRGYRVDLAVLRHYERDDHFCTWPYELQSSLSATARAVHTLKLAGEEVGRHAAHLAAFQCADDRWNGDKWNSSWLYTTSHVALALVAAGGHHDQLARALETILAHQHHDGGWSGAGRSNATETAYAVLTLRSLAAIPAFAERVGAPLARARAWLNADYRPFHPGDALCWIGKEMYRPYRVDRAFELSAMLALELHHEQSASH